MQTPDDEYFELTDASPTTAFYEYLDAKGLDYSREEYCRLFTIRNLHLWL